MSRHRVGRPLAALTLAYPTAVLADGPLGYWRLDEAAGTIAVDQRGTNNGTYSNAVNGGLGVSTQVSLLNTDPDPAVAFTSSQYVDFGNPAAFQLTTGTIECWVQTSQAADASFHGIMVKDNAFGLFLIGTTGTLGCYDWGAGTQRDSGVSISDGKPHHVVLTFQSGVANGTILYLDGQPILTTTITVSNQAIQMRVGNSSAAQPLAGTFDEPAIYDHVLTQAQITNHYRLGSVRGAADVQTGTLILGGQVPVEISGLTLPTAQHGRQMPLGRGVRDRSAMLRYVRFGSFAAPLFQDTPTGTLILGGQVPVEIGGVTVVSPAHGRLMPLSRGVRDQRAMFRYARSSSFPAPVFQDALTGALVFLGSVPVEISGLTLPTPAHGRAMPLKRGIRDRPAMLRYRSSPVKVAAAVLFQDASTGALIFAGGRTELKTGTDARTGILIFAGSAILGVIETDAQTGALIFTGTATSDTIIPNPVVTPVRSRSKLAWVDYGAIREPF